MSTLSCHRKVYKGLITADIIKMKTQSIISVLVASFLMVALAVTASAGQISSLEVNGITVVDGMKVAGFYRDVVPVRVEFSANELNEDVRVKAWFSGSAVNSVTSERFDILPNSTYSRFVSVPLPTDFDSDNTEELYTLNVVIESQNSGQVASKTAQFYVQRESYVIDILDVISESQVAAGANLAVDVVLKNRGRQLAEDTFVSVRIPALGVEQRSYFGDMSATDRANPDKEDASERRMNVRIPAASQPGVYTMEVTAYNSDAEAKVTKRIIVVGAAEDSRVVTLSNTKTIKRGESVTFQMTLVNTGNKIRVYELIPQSVSGLSIQVSDPLAAIPAGMSKTVTVTVEGEKEGDYSFVVDVRADSDLVKSEQFNIRVKESFTAGSAGLIVVVVLAIVFVVLLVVLIVLLTRKPAKKEELGESYY